MNAKGIVYKIGENIAPISACVTPTDTKHRTRFFGGMGRLSILRDVTNFLLGACTVLGMYSFIVGQYHCEKGPTSIPLQLNTQRQHTRDNQSVPCFHNKTRVVFFFGTRPEIIKMAPVIEIFRRHPVFDVVSVFTGQHPDLIKPFQQFWNLSIDIHINGIMRPGQSLSMLLANLVSTIEQEVPSCTSTQRSEVWIVQGDTTSALAAGLVAFNRGVAVAHIEAGLRTGDMRSPFPEELNRKALALITTLHFTPTDGTRSNLFKEGVEPRNIFVTGNTVIDAVRLAERSIIEDTLPAIRPFVELDPASSALVFVTMHRRENQEIMQEVLLAIAEVPCSHCRFVIPVHPNPAATRAATTICAQDARFHCVEPLDYASTQWMLNRSRLILTDSGGLQEESTWYGTPTIVLRDTTERPEAVQAGLSTLMGRNITYLKDIIGRLVHRPDTPVYKSMSRRLLPFGDGHASERIRDTILQHSHGLHAFAPLRFALPPASNARQRLGDESFSSTLSHRLEQCADKKEASWSAACYLNATATVVLSVYKRNSLVRQLNEAARQSLSPVQILVVQNENHVDAKGIVAEWRRKNPEVKVQLVHFSGNSGYHSRFHVAYMLSNSEYVSIWDDDVIAGRDWVAENIRQSKQLGDALMGGNGRCILSLPSKNNNLTIVHQEPRAGQNDFVGHSWTLKRDHLRSYFAMRPFTYQTGEDIQLAFALQMSGISAYMTRQSGKATLTDDKDLRGDENASYRRKEKGLVRNLLLCEVIRAGFRTLYCDNCVCSNVAEACINELQPKVNAIDWGADEEVFGGMAKAKST